MNLIQFEGRTVAVIAPEDLEALVAENAKLREELDRIYESNPPRMPQDPPAEF